MNKIYLSLRLFSFLLLLLIGLFSISCFSNEIDNNKSPLSLTQAQLPAELEVIMLKGLYADRAEIGDKVQFKVLEPLNLPTEKVFIPKDSIIWGKVVMAEESERALKKAKIKVILDSIIYPNSYSLSVSGHLMGNKQNSYNPNNNTLYGKTSKFQQMLRIGKVGVGALLAGPLGAVTSAGALILDKGGRIRINEGDKVYIYLESVGFMAIELNVEGQVNENNN